MKPIYLKKSFLISLLVHMIVVGILINLDFVVPYLLRVKMDGYFLRNPNGQGLSGLEYLSLLYRRENIYHFLSLVLLLVPLSELNYWLIIKKHLLGKVMLSSAGIGLLVTISTLFPFRKLGFLNFPFAPLYAFLIYTGYAMAYGLIRRYFYERAHSRELRLQVSENELNALKAQLNPHFFFNSLNYLYGIALKEHAVMTAAAVSTLSDMMRYTVTGMNENFVPLEDELIFISNYLALQRARIPEKESINIRTSIFSEAKGRQIAPLLLLPFIENAFKYGISVDHPSDIRIIINAYQDKLTMEVINRIISEHNEVKGNNTGIANVRKRLELLYKENYNLHCGEGGEEYHAFLQLDF